MERQPKIATVTLSWNQKDDLREMLSCIKRQTCEPTETIVVDNGSTDGTQEMMRMEFPWVKFFPLDNNTGYAKGYNICFNKVSRTVDYVVVLDQDIAIKNNYIETIVSRFEKEPDETIILMCDLEEPLIKTFNKPEGYFKTFHGSCWSYKNKYRHLIRFEEPFFAYSNEPDLSARLLNRGFKILFYPKCKVYHKHDSTKRSSFRLFLETRNWLWTIWRNYPFSDVLISSFFAAIHMFRKSIYNGKPYAFIRGVVAAFAGLPYCRRTREVCKALSWKDLDEIRFIREL